MKHLILICILSAISPPYAGLATQTTTRRIITVQILGAVLQIGIFKISKDTPLEKAIIAVTGGFKPMAARNHLKISRRRKDGKYDTQEIDLNKKNTDPVGNFMQDGDVVFIPEFVA